MLQRFELLILAMFAVVVSPGCDGIEAVTGGTRGVLHAGTDTFSEMQVNIFQIEGSDIHPIGFAVTTSDGAFELVSNHAEGPLVLTAGEYRCTLESAGAPLRFPKEYANPTKTPLKVTWSNDDVVLDLQVPPPRIVR